MNKPLLCALLFLAGAAQARVDMTCLASGERNDGTWTPMRRVAVEFYATRELYPDENQAYPIYARIWYRQDVPALAAIDGTSLVLPRVEESHIERAFAGGRVRAARDFLDGDPPVPWRIQCSDRSGWIDGAFARRLAPPPEAPSSPSFEPGRRPRLSGSSASRSGAMVCRYDDGSTLALQAGASCPSVR